MEVQENNSFYRVRCRRYCVLICIYSFVIIYRDLSNHTTVVDPLPTEGRYEQPSALAAASLATAHGETAGSVLETVLAVSEDHVYEPIPADSDLSPVTKYENCPLPIPQESLTHIYNTTSHKSESANFSYDYVTTVRCTTALPEPLASSKSNGYSVPRKARDGSQIPNSEGEGYGKLNIEFPQDSSVHVYNTTSHGVKPANPGCNFAPEVTVSPEEASASSKACMNVYSVPRKLGDESQLQKASADSEQYATLDVGSLPALQYTNFGPPSGAVPNPYQSLPRNFGDCTGSDSTRCEGQEDSSDEEEYIKMY